MCQNGRRHLIANSPIGPLWFVPELSDLTKDSTKISRYYVIRL